MVTGGAGYVGSVLVPQLMAAGHKVTVLDLFMYGDSVFDAVRNNADLRLVKGDIRDEAAVNEALRGNNAVIHLACISNDPSFELDPALGKSINYDCFRPMVRAAKKAGIKRFIYASSSSVYGIKNEAEVTEDLSCEPLTDYSKFKAMCETDLADEAASGFVTCTVRPATVTLPTSATGELHAVVRRSVATRTARRRAASGAEFFRGPTAGVAATAAGGYDESAAAAATIVETWRLHANVRRAERADCTRCAQRTASGGPTVPGATESGRARAASNPARTAFRSAIRTAVGTGWAERWERTAQDQGHVAGARNAAQRFTMSCCSVLGLRFKTRKPESCWLQPARSSTLIIR